MSRCFPFPPPGYEKKARADDADLIKKEKQREKRHKKEKRDKEKKEDKEKREKDRSDGKYRDKKDRKEKHRDKKKAKEDRDKDKDKDKDREKASSSGEKRVSAQHENCSGDKLTQKEKIRDKDKISNSDEKKQAIQFRGYDGEKLIRDSLPAVESDHSRFVQELGRRIRDEQNGAGSQLFERFTGADKKKDEGVGRLVAKHAATLAEGREKNKDKRIDNSKMDGRGIKDEAGFSGNRMVQNIAGMVQNGVQEMPRPTEKYIEKRIEGKEKSKKKEGDNKQGEKQDREREKNSQMKHKGREKEMKVEKVKERSDYKKTEQDKLKDSNKKDLIGAQNIKNLHLPKECDKSFGAEGNLKKRKVLGTNGFLHDNDVRPNKMPRPTSHSLPENGRKLEPCQTLILVASDRQGAVNNLKVDNKERKLNGIIEVQPSLSISSTKPSPAITQADQIAEALVKPPHPDSKYLSQVLSVPKMDEWSDCDDQEWLFNCKDPPSKKLEVGSVGVNETPQVWAEAMQIESADVCALPYVIPY